MKTKQLFQLEVNTSDSDVLPSFIFPRSFRINMEADIVSVGGSATLDWKAIQIWVSSVICENLSPLTFSYLILHITILLIMNVWITFVQETKKTFCNTKDELKFRISICKFK